MLVTLMMRSLRVADIARPRSVGRTAQHALWAATLLPNNRLRTAHGHSSSSSDSSAAALTL